MSVGTQTDLMLVDLTSLENDYQQRLKEYSEVRNPKEFPDQDKLENDEKLLRFNTSLSTFIVLMAVFNLVSATLTETPLSKPSKFHCYTLTLMKFRLNASNYDLGYHFEISSSTVSRVLSKWIEAMDVRLSFLICWSDRESIQKIMPFCFRPNYGLSVTSIIDCFKLYI